MNLYSLISPGIFACQEGVFETIAAADSEISVRSPSLNNSGTVAFYRSFFDEVTQEFVEELATGNGGRLTTIAVTRGDFSSFGFRPPSIYQPCIL
jgi:hypothetical protein